MIKVFEYTGNEADSLQEFLNYLKKKNNKIIAVVFIPPTQFGSGCYQIITDESNNTTYDI